MRKITLFLVLVLFQSSDAWAWGAAGHRIVAAIAFRRLSTTEQKRIVEILSKHPRFENDFVERMPASIAEANERTQNDWHFQQAALWPDLVRDFHGELKDRFHRPSWHFINKPIFLTPADRAALEGSLTVNLELRPPAAPDADMNVVQTIRLARKTLNSQSASGGDKGLMLSWLFHTVGDVHQPLHSTALFSRHLFPRGDRGGNSVTTEQVGNLHSLWDRFPGNSNSFSSARNRAAQLLRIPNMESLGEAAEMDLDEEQWLKESHQRAVDSAYDSDLLAHLRVFDRSHDDELLPMDLSDEYLRDGREIADQCVVEAGFRLGAILKELARN